MMNATNTGPRNGAANRFRYGHNVKESTHYVPASPTPEGMGKIEALFLPVETPADIRRLCDNLIRAGLGWHFDDSFSDEDGNNYPGALTDEEAIRLEEIREQVWAVPGPHDPHAISIEACKVGGVW